MLFYYHLVFRLAWKQQSINLKSLYIREKENCKGKESIPRDFLHEPMLQLPCSGKAKNA